MICGIRRFSSAAVRYGKRVAVSDVGDTGVIEEDRIRLSLRAGNGGSGLARYNGVGGDGGNVFAVASHQARFSDIRKGLKNRARVVAEDGAAAQQIKLVGMRGHDKTIRVPIGVEIVNSETQILIARCKRPSHRYLVAQGGEGGCSSNNFCGTRGESLVVDLHLKLRPNVGLVGFPNAGKSTLLKALVPQKKVKIASYPFTTTKPQLCYLQEFGDAAEMEKPEQFSLSIADLPGLIEGASENRGKGISFLKHLEYSDVLLVIVDIGGFQLSPSPSCPYRSALECVALLNVELEKYDPQLVAKPAIVAINKIDLPDGEKKAEELKLVLLSRDWHKSLPNEVRPVHPLTFLEVIPVCAKEARLSNLKACLKNVYSSRYLLSDPLYDTENSDSTPRLV